MRTVKPMPLPGYDTNAIQPWETEHAKVARKAAAEGFVLLKNENKTLPLKKGSKVALFGVGAVQTVKGGTGSGDVNERYDISIAQGLENAGFVLTTKDWLQRAEQIYTDARIAWRDAIMDDYRKNGGIFFLAYSSHAFRIPAGDPIPTGNTETNTAVYVISRIAGEGADRDAGKGDYLLTDEEEAHIHTLCRCYEKVVLLLNVGGVIDLGILDREPNIRAVLLIGQPGMEGGNAVGDVLCGDVPVSGKLTNTWAQKYEDYPNAMTFSRMNGDVEHEIYTEDIYVGYRYFDTFGIPVRFGFGEGLSYTDFRIENVKINASADGKVNVRAAVKNTGGSSGREVVQVYLMLPDIKPGRELRRLVAFARTPLLQADETCEVVMCFGPQEAASYCESRAVWAVPAGRYGVCVGSSLKDSAVYGWLDVKEEKILEKCENICPCQQEIDTLRPDAAKRAELADAVPQRSAETAEWDLSGVKTVCYVYGNPDESGDEAAAIAETLSEDQMIRLVIGDPSRGQGSTIGAAGVSVPGSAAETSGAALEQGVAGIILADGPAGLRLTPVCHIQDGKAVNPGFLNSIEHGFFAETTEEPAGERRYQYCTAIPVGSLLSQSWDPEVLSECGDAVGDEMERMNVTLWLAPGMNIHRNPLCGRNFEYYSEDPLLSGKMAAAMTAGVQKHPGCGTTIKHYACNNQEDNRMGSDSILTERALREIYLRGFGIAIRESKPMSIMTSYNFINGIHSANNYDLCTKAARNEFGFKGAIMTDWGTTNHGRDCCAAGCIRAGNDWTMPGQPMDHESVRNALADGSLSRQELKDCVIRIIRVILQSSRY